MKNYFRNFSVGNILLFLLFTNLFVTAQEDQKIIVDSIAIKGNDITEDFIILRELNFEVGDTVSQKQIDFNQERIFSLGLFNKVKLDLDSSASKNIVAINVKESWYIYPLPYLKLRDNKISNASYGLILLYKNFRGRNETLTGYSIFGYDPAYMLSYYNPILFTGEDISFGFEVAYSNIINKNLSAKELIGTNFDYRYIFGTTSLGYRLNLYNEIFTSLAYEYVEVPPEVAKLTSNKSNIDRTLSFSLVYELDNRNLKQFSSDGLFLSTLLSHKGLSINDISYNIFKVDLRKYNHLVGDLSGKFRFLYRNTFGSKIPFYDFSLFGYDEFVRGHKSNVREGHNYLLSSLEFNYPIIKEWNLSLDLPLLPKSLTSARIGLYLNSFFDTGTTYYNYEKLEIKRFDSGWGFGLTLLILPYNAIRFEYAFDEYRKGEFLLESGFSF